MFQWGQCQWSQPHQQGQRQWGQRLLYVPTPQYWDMLQSFNQLSLFQDIGRDVDGANVSLPLFRDWLIRKLGTSNDLYKEA